VIARKHHGNIRRRFAEVGIMLQRARNAALMQLAAGELKYFANANLRGNTGNMSVFKYGLE
jgi:hypothetical protein